MRFIVRDSGIGIAGKNLEHIFDAFTQADSSTSRRFGGTGLGLTISRQLAELMGGSLNVESVEGEGATFWFTAVFERQGCDPLPLLVEGRSVPVSGEGLAGKGGRGNGRTRLLLAEDDATSQFVMKSILINRGYQIEVAGDGGEALRLLEHNDYAAVLMDCMMPVLNGYDVTAVIRDPASNVRNHDIPVIALTANAFGEDRGKCLEAGMNDYLAKPLEVEKLFELLDIWAPSGSAPETPPAPDGDLAVLKPITGDGKTLSRYSADVFDMNAFVSRNQNNVKLSRDAAALFIAGAADYGGAIRNAMTARDAVALRKAAHKLKGAAGNFSLKLLSESAKKVETVSGAGDPEKVAAYLPELEGRLEEAVEALRVFITTHGKDNQ